MIRLEDNATRLTAHRQRVAIDGVWHLIIPLASLEGIAYDAPGSIDYPYPGDGWATTRIGTTRFAAWFGGAA